MGNNTSSSPGLLQCMGQDVFNPSLSQYYLNQTFKWFTSGIQTNRIIPTPRYKTSTFLKTLMVLIAPFFNCLPISMPNSTKKTCRKLYRHVFFDYLIPVKLWRTYFLPPTNGIRNPAIGPVCLSALPHCGLGLSLSP